MSMNKDTAECHLLLVRIQRSRSAFTGVTKLIVSSIPWEDIFGGRSANGLHFMFLEVKKKKKCGRRDDGGDG